MVQTDPDELVEDAEIEGLPKRSGFVSFLLGLALGGVTSVAVLLGLSLSHPLPRDLPGIGNVRIEGSESATAPTRVVIAEQTPASGVESEASSPTETNAASTETKAATAETTQSESGQSDDAKADPVSGSETDAETSSVQAGTDSAATTAETSAEGDAEQALEPVTDATTGDSSTVTETSQQGTPTTAQTDTEQADASRANAVDETADPDLQVAAVTPVEPVQPATSLTPVAELNLPGPAIEVNSREFDAPLNAPLLAIVLEDAGNGALEAEALALMTMPLTLAIRPEGAASTALAKAARSAKHEVLVQLPFARSDAEQSADFLHVGMSDPDRGDLTERNLAQLPDALGVVPPDGATLLNDAQAMRSVIAPLQKHGFAFIDLTAGSGSKVEALARDAGVSYSETSRYVPEGATDQQVFNSIEASAFQARQRGSAIVQIASSRAALTAILRWGLEKDRRPVWFAPVSAVLARQAATK